MSRWNASKKIISHNLQKKPILGKLKCPYGTLTFVTTYLYYYFVYKRSQFLENLSVAMIHLKQLISIIILFTKEANFRCRSKKVLTTFFKSWSRPEKSWQNLNYLKKSWLSQIILMVSTILHNLNKNLDTAKSWLKSLNFKNLNREKKIYGIEVMDNIDT